MNRGAIAKRVLPRGMAVALVLASAGFAATASAGDPPGSPQEYLHRMDTDHDGRVSVDEYVAWMIETFDGIDTDHNGVLEGEELPEGSKPVTRADYRKSLEAAFARQDTNHDGFLDARELARPPR